MSSKDSQLANWLALARQGNESARNQLFAACRSYVAVIARMQLHRRLQAKVDPSDLVQQSMLEAHRGFEGFHGQTPQDWLAWLKHVVQHNAIDADKHYRGAARRDLRRELQTAPLANSESHAPWSPIDTSPSPSEFMLQSEQEVRLATAIEQLPDDYRQVVLLRNIERLSFDEVALQMSRSRGACQMLWARAVEQLRMSFQDGSQL